MPEKPRRKLGDRIPPAEKLIPWLVLATITSLTLSAIVVIYRPNLIRESIQQCLKESGIDLCDGDISDFNFERVQRCAQTKSDLDIAYRDVRAVLLNIRREECVISNIGDEDIK